MMKSSGLCLATILCCLAISNVSARTGNETDKLALLEFKANINEDPLGLLRSWNESVQFCSWPGVTCASRIRQRVTRLDVSKWHLKGQLSPHIGNLSFLRVLNLSNNDFRLEIPAEIGRLFRLQVLRSSNNSFSGKIPANISGCSELQHLLLDFNNLIGGIPREIGSMSAIRTIVLGGNRLGGGIPAFIGNLSSLERLEIWENSLKGNIPDSLGQLKSLKSLSIANNNLSGTIPLSLYNISTIQFFAVGINQLEGQIPDNLGHTLPNLRNFLFYYNNFSGPLPSTISNASNLVIFHVHSNHLTGKIPSFAKFSNMVNFGVGQNNLGFAKNDDLNFLNDIVNCTELLYLSCMDNNLGGTIPETIGNVTRTKMKALDFERNQVSGNIPSGIGNLIDLEVLSLEHNRLTGPIPSTIGKLRNLNYLSVEDNNLSGTIPDALQNLTLLSKMFLSRNNFQGSIPPSLGEIKNLQELSLAENNLSGHIPPQLMRLSSLTIALNLSWNQLNGSIPMEVGKLVNLGILDISDNNLSGEIPNAIGSCGGLEYLYLQGNFLQGSIPTQLDSLRGVREIDLSRNNLSGQIPMYFEEFRGLLYLNLSFNEFEGQVPQLGVFRNASKFSITGNKMLCGGLPELRLSPCISIKKTFSWKTKLVIIISCSVVGLILILSLAVLNFYSNKRNQSTLESPYVILLPRISYEDLSIATDGFSSANLIGVGSFGSVYKGILQERDTLVAVKVLNLHVARALKSFTAECESLRNIKHRNLVKLVTVCSSIDFQGNEFKALVYEFMKNGNLEQWLYSSHRGQEQSHCLNLIQRISIAIDVASALDYLHNHCYEVIAHRDIKPSNILLDSEMVARVGDFGLAKLLSSSFTDQTSSFGVGGTVGYVAPEYSMGSEVSTSGDTYSFGILLLEMFTGKRPTDNMFKDDFNLNNFASMALPDRIAKIVDPLLLEQGDEYEQPETVYKSLVSIVELGVSCSSKLPGDRRNIGDVAAELCKIKTILNGHRMPQIRVKMRKA